MFTSFVVGILSAALSAVVLTGGRTIDLTDFEGHLALAAVVLSGVLGGTIASAIRQYFELRRLRAMRNFLENWAGNGQLQPVVDGALIQRAGAVRGYSEKLIRLQQDGLRAEENPQCDATDEEGLVKTFEYVKSRLLGRFRDSQDEFYRTYDQIRLFADMVRVKLKGRNWKAYSGEPEVAKRGSRGGGVIIEA